MKRVFAIVMTLCLLLCMAPMQAQAAVDTTYGKFDVYAYYGDYTMVTVSHYEAYPGETVTVTPHTGYKITKLEVYMGEAELVPSTYSDSLGSFTMPYSSVEIWVEVSDLNGGGAPFNILLLSAGGGTPTADKYTATAGQTVTISPNPDAGNVFKNIQIDYYRVDGHNEIYYLADGVTSFVMPDNIQRGGEVKVVCYYERDPNAGAVTTPLEIIHAPYGEGTLEGPTSAVPGTVVTFTATPEAGYKADITVYNARNTSLTVPFTRISQTQYRFTMPEDAVMIYVMFTAGEDNYTPGSGDGEGGGNNGGGNGGTTEEGVYNITVQENEFVTVEVQETSEPSTNVYFYVTPDPGYTVKRVYVYSNPSGKHNFVHDYGDGEWTFIMPESDVRIYVQVEAEGGGSQNPDLQYDVTVKPTDNGTVSVNPTRAAADTTVTVTPDPATGYTLKELTVKGPDGQNLPLTKTDNGYTFVMPAGTVEVSAVFAKIAHTTNPDTNGFHADINMDDDDILDLLLDEDDLLSGEDVVVFMEVVVKEPINLPAGDEEAIVAAAGEDEIASYLDIKLFKKIGNREPEPITNVSGNGVTITMEIPAGTLPAGATPYIIYRHNGVVKTIKNVSYNASTGVLSFNASEFSTYALAYTPSGSAGPNVPPVGPNEPVGPNVPPVGPNIPVGPNHPGFWPGFWPGNRPGGTLDNVPKTGESPVLSVLAALALGSAATLAGAAIYDKKRRK